MAKHGRMTEEEATYELQEQIQSRRAVGNMLAEKWMRNDIGGSDLQKMMNVNPYKARNIAMALTSQENYLRSLSEAIVSTNFSVRPENLLKAVKIGVANSNRGEIFTEYPLQSTDDVLFYIWTTYEQSLRGSTAGEKVYEKINQFYAGEQAMSSTLGTGNGVTTTFSLAAVSPLPLIPRTINLIVGNALVAKDDGSGNFVDFTSGATLATSLTNTVSYTLGTCTLNFAVAPANGATIKLMYNWSSENSDNFASLGTIGITLDKKRFNARPMPLGYNYSMMTQISLDTTGIGNAEDMLMETVGHEHAKSRDYRAIQRARQIAMGNAMATFNTDFAAVGEISLKSHAQNTLKAIREVGASIYDDIKRGTVNKIVAGSRALPFLELHDRYVEDMTQPRSGVYKAGRLSDIEVYSCPADSNILNNNELLLT
jgi:hypothetical protein